MKNTYFLFSIKDKYFTDLASVLKKHHNFKNFYGFAYAKTATLKNKIFGHITYASNLIKQPEPIDWNFLNDLEKKYDINLSEMMHADRHLKRLAKHTRLPYAQKFLKAFLKDIAEFKIDLIISEGVDDLVSFFAVQYCQYHKIPFLYSMYAGYGVRTFLSDNLEAAPIGFKPTFKKYLLVKDEQKAVEVDKQIQDYLINKTGPGYLSQFNLNYRVFSFQDVKLFFKYLINHYYDRHGFHYDVSPLWVPLQRFIRILQKTIYRRFLKKQNLPNNVDYFIYPLHFEPEAATLINGRWFNDQLKIIEMISKNLPINTVLYVKEHKPSIGKRPLNFYKKIADHHNVFLVDDKINSLSLIKDSKGVITISSTMGLEALMLQKPVIMFGNRYYQVSTNVFEMRDIKMLKQQLKNVLSHQFDHNNNFALFAALLETTKEAGEISHHFYKENDLIILAKEIMAHLQKPHSEMIEVLN